MIRIRLGSALGTAGGRCLGANVLHSAVRPPPDRDQQQLATIVRQLTRSFAAAVQIKTKHAARRRQHVTSHRGGGCATRGDHRQCSRGPRRRIAGVPITPRLRGTATLISRRVYRLLVSNSRSNAVSFYARSLPNRQCTNYARAIYQFSGNGRHSVLAEFSDCREL